LSVDVTVETIIERPVEEVSAYAADPTNAPTWYDNIDSVEWRTDPPVQVGSEMDFVARFLGRRMAYTYRVTDFVPGERLVMSTERGPFPMETTYTWNAVEGGTRMTLRNTGLPSGFARLGAAVLEKAMRRTTTKDLARLKAILER
jgi:uncharacterized protein YndB with AHSA1/START domain